MLTDQNPMSVKTPLPPEQVLVRSMSGHEELGRLFEYEVELLTDIPDVPFKALLGKPMTVSVAKRLGERHFNGIITRLTRAGRHEDRFVLRAALSPKLWILTRKRDCRVFQDMTVPEILQKILGDHGIEYDARITAANYRKWDYLTQYRESDFAFISRLMEQEGIYYYFKHEEDKHVMVLADSALNSHDTVENYDLMQVRRSGGIVLQRDHLTTVRHLSRLRSARVTLLDHDFRMRHGSDIRAIARAEADHADDTYELYDYPSEYLLAENKEDTDVPSTRQAGEHYAQVQLEEHRTEREHIEAEGNASGLEVGARFGLDTMDLIDKKFVIAGTHHEFRNRSLDASGGDGPFCHVSVLAIDDKRQFRSARITDRPLISGPQTARVVGKEGEEIWTDKYGRVKVQFHWDREGQQNEKSSVFVRVAQMWAGSNWGTIHIPRIGQEVVVQFLEGDPDRPLIVGSVYNADNMPPYKLPDNATQSGIKTRSSKGGTPDNFNEIRFEDKKGQEELHVQAEKNMSVLVKNNQSTTVNASRSISVGGGESHSVSGTRSLTVTKKETDTFKDEREVTVTAADVHTNNGKRTEHYNAGRERDVKSFDNTTVNGANKNTTVHGQYNITADEHYKVTQGGNQIYVKDEVFVESVGPVQLKNGGTHLEMKDGKVKLTASDEITFECGASSITLKSDGTITITGSQSVTATGGAGGVELAQTGATMSGPKATISGSAMTEITGAIVKVN